MAISTSKTEIIVNSVIAYWAFLILKQSMYNWLHIQSNQKVLTRKKQGITEIWMKRRKKSLFKGRKFRFAAQQEEMGMLREAVQKMQEWCQGGTNARQKDQVDEITVPCDAEQNMQESRAAAAPPPPHMTSKETVIQMKISGNNFHKRYHWLLLFYQFFFFQLLICLLMYKENFFKCWAPHHKLPAWLSSSHIPFASKS